MYENGKVDSVHDICSCEKLSKWTWRVWLKSPWFVNSFYINFKCENSL